MKIGVYVGSFDPVHKGHKHVIDYLVNNKLIDKLIIIPTNNYWDKKMNCSLENRIQMLKLYENENVIINNNLNNFEYTYQVLDELKKIYKKDILHLIIGADNIEKFHLWKEVDKILQNKVIVFGRNKIDIKVYINKFDKRYNFILYEDFEEMNVSSTQIREFIKNKDVRLNELLDECVLKYILNNNLYS